MLSFASVALYYHLCVDVFVRALQIILRILAILPTHRILYLKWKFCPAFCQHIQDGFNYYQ
jgi:hypothetical protein